MNALACSGNWRKLLLSLRRSFDVKSRSAMCTYVPIPTFPRSTAVGHAGQLVVGKLTGTSGDVPVAVMQGRVHLYEGYPAAEVAFPTRVLGRTGIRALILTNAAGGINVEYGQGALVILRD